MSQDMIDQTQPVQAISVEALGHGCKGSFGPNSEREAESTNSYSDEKYISIVTPESHCMDDRFEGHGLQLPGNRAITEIAGQYMDPDHEELSLSRATARKVQELIHMGREPYFHGDEHKGKAGCAANANLRMVLINNQNDRESVSDLAFTRLRLSGIDTLSINDIHQAIETGARRANQDELWDISAEEVFDIAAQNGAPTEIFKGEHRTAGIREDVSGNTFNNGVFRQEHTSDDGSPLGVLSINYGAYKNQLKEDGFSETDIAKKLMHAALFSVGICKLAAKPEAIDVIVG